MGVAVALLTVPVSALVTAGGLIAAGVPRRRALRAGAAAGLATGVALVALWLTAFGECAGENSNRPFTWPWSPRREFCDDGSSPAALLAPALLLLPIAVVIIGTVLYSKVSPTLGWATYALLLATPFLPSLYVGSLAEYRLDEYPVLHRPLLRPAEGPRPARVCYVHGIKFGPRKVNADAAPVRNCVELRSTPRARRLTPSYDGGVTVFDLEALGHRLTENGLPIRSGGSGIDGLEVVRAYELPADQARAGATLVDTAP